MKLAVAATAPFGADVLERLAAHHEITALLTRPDAPRGRGRKTGAPPAKETADRLGLRVLQPARPEPGLDLGADTVVVAAYGLLIPENVLDEGLWLNVHPSLLPRWRGAAPVERAIMAGDTETGVTIHRTVKELDAGPIAAQRAFPIGEDDDAGTVFEQAAALAVELLDEVLPEPQFTPQEDEGLTYAEKITAADRDLDLSSSPEQLLNTIRALSPHIGAACRARRSPGHDLEGASLRREARAARGAAGGQAAHDVRRVSARPAMTARQAAYEVVLRVFEDDAYADRVLRTAAKDLDSRDRALAQRLAFGTVQRARTLDHAIETLGKRPVRKLDPPVRAALRLGAYQLGYTEVAQHAAVNETVELVRRARLERAVAFTNAVMRRLTQGIAPLLAALPDDTPVRAALKHSYPDWVAELWWEEFGREGALALMEAQNEPPERVVRMKHVASRDTWAGVRIPTSRTRCTSTGSTSTPLPPG